MRPIWPFTCINEKVGSIVAHPLGLPVNVKSNVCQKLRTPRGYAYYNITGQRGGIRWRSNCDGRVAWGCIGAAIHSAIKSHRRILRVRKVWSHVVISTIGNETVCAM